MSAVEHILGTIEELAAHFIHTGSDVVQTVDVHTLEDKAGVISVLLDSLKSACPEPGFPQIKYKSCEWNTWLTTSACARPSSLPGRKSGRRAPQAVPSSNFVWWIDKADGGTVHSERYIHPPELSSASMDVRRSVKLRQNEDVGSIGLAEVVAVSEDAVAHLHQSDSHIYLDTFPAERDSLAQPQPPTPPVHLSMHCSIDMAVFRSNEASSQHEDAETEPHQLQHQGGEHQGGRSEAPTSCGAQGLPPQHDASTHDATKFPLSTKKRQAYEQADASTKKARSEPIPSISQTRDARACNKEGATQTGNVWQEELSPDLDLSQARMSRINALSVCSLQHGSEAKKHGVVCAAGVLTLPTSFACTQEPAGDTSEPPCEYFNSVMVWVVPMHASEATNSSAAHEAVAATCVLVNNDDSVPSLPSLGAVGTQSVAVQPVLNDQVLCCTAAASGGVTVWLLQFQSAREGASMLCCSQCEMLMELQPLGLESPALTVTSLCAQQHAARVVRWAGEHARTHLQLHVEASDDRNTCLGCSRFGGCCSCSGCGGVGAPRPRSRPVQGIEACPAPHGSFTSCDMLTHAILFQEFGRTTAVAVCGKFVFAGSDAGAVAVWECGADGVVERVAGWWLEGESVSVVVAARVDEQVFILVGMHSGQMYSFDTMGQLQ